MSLTDIITLAGAAIIALVGARASREPKNYHCIDGYAQCISAKVEDEQCLKILNLCKKPKEEEVEDES